MEGSKKESNSRSFVILVTTLFHLIFIFLNTCTNWYVTRVQLLVPGTLSIRSSIIVDAAVVEAAAAAAAY